MRILLCLLVISEGYIAYGQQQQSVAQQCLTEQVRNNNNFQPVRTQGQPTAASATLNAFRAICQNYNNYIQCFQNRLRGSTAANDNFLDLVFDARNMRSAYQGLCRDLPILQSRINCLLTTPQVQRCYDNFRQAVIQVVNLDRQGRLQRRDLEAVACNVSISRYQCETQVYSFCDQTAGEIMRSFFFAGVPGRCRRETGVTSRYTQMFGGSGVTRLSFGLLLVPFTLLFKLLS